MEKKIYELFSNRPGVKEIRVIADQELVNHGMNLIYNVGKAAPSKPRAVYIHYVGDPSRENEVDFGIVGKGVTFDTGGYNIKTMMMEEMYGDKGGSCSVIGAGL